MTNGIPINKNVHDIISLYTLNLHSSIQSFVSIHVFEKMMNPICSYHIAHRIRQQENINHNLSI